MPRPQSTETIRWAPPAVGEISVRIDPVPYPGNPRVELVGIATQEAGTIRLILALTTSAGVREFHLGGPDPVTLHEQLDDLTSAGDPYLRGQEPGIRVWIAGLWNDTAHALEHRPVRLAHLHLVDVDRTTAGGGQ